MFHKKIDKYKLSFAITKAMINEADGVSQSVTLIPSRQMYRSESAYLLSNQDYLELIGNAVVRMLKGAEPGLATSESIEVEYIDNRRKNLVRFNDICICCDMDIEPEKRPEAVADRHGNVITTIADMPTFDSFTQIMTDVADQIKANAGLTWAEVYPTIEDKYRLYEPILHAYAEELGRLLSNRAGVEQFFRYCFGNTDFYKVAVSERKRELKITAYNPNGTIQPDYSARTIPTELQYIGIKDDSYTTLEIRMNYGWVISLRLHSCEKIINPASLRCEISFAGSQPYGLYSASGKY